MRGIRLKNCQVISIGVIGEKELWGGSMRRKASAVWSGGLKTGKGVLSTESEVLRQVPYSFATRFENDIATNPEELLAAAHASCFAMALSAELGLVGITPDTLSVSATVTIDRVKDGFSITESHLDLIAHVPNVDPMVFERAVKTAEIGCPVSKLFRTKITIAFKLV